jgi:ketosteroid isomerase-like protein
MPESNVELARRGYEAAVRGDLDPIAELLDPEVKWHGGDPSNPAACHNRSEALAFMRAASARRGIGDLVDIVDAGDRVVVIMQPRDRSADRVANLTTFRNGRVIEMVHFPNPDDALAAAGV